MARSQQLSRRSRNDNRATRHGSFPIRRLCTYIISEILSWCSPVDLVVVRGLSKDFKAFLDSKPHGLLCWKRARANITYLPPPPFSSKYNLDEHAYAAFLFNVARKSCICCGRPATGKFPIIMYKVNICNRLPCLQEFESDTQGHLFTYHRDKKSIRIYAPVLSALPYNLSPTGQKMFMVQHAKQELKEYQRLMAARNTEAWAERLEQKKALRHLLNNHSSVLYAWTPRYWKFVDRVQRLNKEFLRAAASAKNIKVPAILASPTACQTLKAFDDSLTLLTSTALYDIWPKVVEECRQQDKRKCRWCPKSFSVTSLQRHIRSLHPYIGATF
ncbi:hypothetical protein EDD85DRAFT_826087 [Armillaria nabsnona]|nr:hypothetical protein EDD85DRAFT_826087 [Armillaria nabsnona]